ncbi:immunoglobulin superfamily member 10-like isoform X1 [Crassostrea angulata]|uniref:immunoglobulin superfamily member 10-like isoform X1 n=1 Tax=Magallana angulata TaxID=2784310 RepID=UPI0022B20B9A|nr:immunoglobulin superfamily member 10-like isoform X1 [Crassostrea angulata]
MTGSPGTTLTIPCTVVSESISTVFWTFQPSDQDNETEKVFSFSKYYWYSSSPSLRIYYLNTSDIGFYRCCANSSSGLGRSTPVYVTLKGKQINVDRSTYSVYTGDDVIFSVSIFSMPDAMNITWMFSTINSYSYYYYAALDLTSDVRYDGGTVSSPSLVIRNVTLSDGGYYLLGLTNVDGTIYSSRISLSVQKSLLVITTEQQYFYDVYTESTVNFELNVTSNLPVLWVSWEKSVVSYFYNARTVNITVDRIFGGTIDDPSLTISNISLADIGYYRFTATNADGSRSVVFYLSVNLHPPTIYVPRTSYTVYTGSNVTLDVNVTSTPSLTEIIWERRNTSTFLYSPIDMAYDRVEGGDISVPSLTILDVEVSDKTYYRMRATNRDGTTISSLIYLDVNTSLLVITTEQQYFYDVYTESTVNFELNVTSNLPVLWVSWEKSVVSYFYNASTVNITVDRIFGGTIDDPALTISNISLADTGYYRFTATNAGGSRSVVFYISVNLHPPTVYLPRTSYTVYTGNNVTLDVNVTSTPSLTEIIWERRNTSTFLYSPIDMAYDRVEGGDISVPSLTILDVEVSDKTYYRMQATNRDGTTISALIYLDVNTSLLVITTEQQYFYDVYTESTVNFELNVTSNLPVLWVSWEKSVVSYFYNASTVNITVDRIFGGTIDDPSLTISNISLADTGYYRFTATNAGGSRSVVFYISVNLHPPTVYLPRTSYTVYTGNNVTLDVNVTSTPSLTEIIWERRNTSTFLYSPIDMAYDRVEGGDISVPSLTILDVEVSDKTYYRMQATNRDGTTISALIYLDVNTRPPVVSVGKISLTAATKASLSLQVNYTSGPKMKSVSWEKGSSFYSFLYVSMNITTNSRFTGGTIDSPSLEISDLKLEDSGYYRCRVTNNDGTTTTPVFTVLVQKQLANVSVAATTYTVSIGNNAILYVTITNLESNSTITWERKGQNEANYNVINTQTNVKYGGGTLVSPSLTIYNITEADVGYYRCKVTNIDGTTTSSLIYIGLKSPDDSSCDKLSCGGLRECVLMNNKPTCSVSTWKAAAVAVAGTVGAAASVAAGVAVLKSLTSKAIQPINGKSQGSNSNSNNRNNRNNNDNNDHNSDNNSDRESNHDDDMPDTVYIGGFQGVINSMPPPNM